MQRTGTTTSTHGGGLFSRLGGSKTSSSSTRPYTNSESTATHSELIFGSTTSRTSTGRTTSISSSSKSPRILQPSRSRNGSISRIAVPTHSPEKRAHSATRYTDSEPLPIPIHSHQDTADFPLPKSADSFRQVAAEAAPPRFRPVFGASSYTSTTPYSNMLVRPTGTNPTMGYNGPMPVSTPLAPPSPTLENITYQHIQETSSKRISTLDYLRKAYEVFARILCENADSILVMKEEYTGLIHYYSTNPIYNECHILIPENSPGARPITFYSASPYLPSSILVLKLR